MLNWDYFLNYLNRIGQVKLTELISTERDYTHVYLSNINWNKIKIELIEITIRELTDGYVDKGLDGVFGYGGLLDIRPQYQREFIYNEKQRDKVIDTIFKGFPLNVMYWSKQNSGVFEVIDGQQRTISIGKFVNGDFSVNNRYFHSLQDDEKEIILNYKIMKTMNGHLVKE